MRAATYARISYDARTGTADEGLGVERQLEDCAALVDRNGWTDAGRFVDNSRSAFAGKDRPAWRDLLAACVEGRVDAVVAWRDDRLWRDVVEERQVGAMLAEHGVELIAFANGRTYRPSDVDDQLTSGLHALVAEHESAVKAVRVRRALEQRAHAGRWRGGTRPYGYRRPTPTEVEDGTAEAGTLIVVEAEAEVLREVARRVLAGEPVAAVASDLAARGVPTSTGRGTWRPGRLRELLTNPLHAGLNHHRGEVIGDGVWPAIIGRDQHEALKAAFGARQRGPGRTPTRLLTGLLRCYRCGHPMTGNVRRGVRLYQCKADKATGSCGGPSVSSDPADEHVRDQVLALLGDSTALADRLAAAGDVDVAEVAANLAADEQRLETLIADHYAGEVPRRAYLNARERLEDRVESYRATLAAAATTASLDAPIGDAEALAGWWEAATAGQRRDLVAALVDHVELRPWEPSMGRRFHPDRLRIVWTA